jgi:hypothetical protein
MKQIWILKVNFAKKLYHMTSYFLNNSIKYISRNFIISNKLMKLKQLFCCLSILYSLLFFTSCNLFDSSKTQENDLSKEEVKVIENEQENGIFRKQKSYTLDSINFTRHQVSLREGQNEETIVYTVFENKALFSALNEAIADFANLARLDSIKISQNSELEADDSEYETIQRTDTVYIISPEVVSMEFNYSFMANGMECENKENKLLSYSLKDKKIITLKDIFGAKSTET